MNPYEIPGFRQAEDAWLEPPEDDDKPDRRDYCKSDWEDDD